MRRPPLVQSSRSFYQHPPGSCHVRPSTTALLALRRVRMQHFGDRGLDAKSLGLGTCDQRRACGLPETQRAAHPKDALLVWNHLTVIRCAQVVALGLHVTLPAEMVYEGPPLGRSWQSRQLRPAEKRAGREPRQHPWSCHPHAFNLNAGDAGSQGRSCITAAGRSHEKAS